MLLQAKDGKVMTWLQLAERIGRGSVYTAMLVYGDGIMSAIDMSVSED